MQQRARPQWWPSPRAGDANKYGGTSGAPQVFSKRSPYAGSPDPALVIPWAGFSLNLASYIVEFQHGCGRGRAISIPRYETAVIKHFQEGTPPMGCSCRTFWVRNLGRAPCVSQAEPS